MNTKESKAKAIETLTNSVEVVITLKNGDSQLQFKRSQCRHYKMRCSNATGNQGAWVRTKLSLIVATFDLPLWVVSSIGEVPYNTHLQAPISPSQEASNDATPYPMGNDIQALDAKIKAAHKALSIMTHNRNLVRDQHIKKQKLIVNLNGWLKEKSDIMQSINNCVMGV